jgi:hypothetical protein
MGRGEKEREWEGRKWEEKGGRIGRRGERGGRGNRWG